VRAQGIETVELSEVERAVACGEGSKRLEIRLRALLPLLCGGCAANAFGTSLFGLQRGERLLRTDPLCRTGCALFGSGVRGETLFSRGDRDVAPTGHPSLRGVPAGLSGV
jgi:hypothetical protein